MRLLRVYPIVFLLGAWVSLAQASLVEHALNVKLNPRTQHLWANDQITLAADAARKQIFSLHKGLNPESPDKEIKIKQLATEEQSIWHLFEIELPAGVNTFTLEYAGQIYHPVQGYGSEQARGYSSTPGLISEEGVYLAASSHWYPQFASQTRLRFMLHSQLPQGWQGVSQGERIKLSDNSHGNESSWQSHTPQEEIYFIAAPFNEYHRQVGDIIAQVFLRHPDQRLANEYLLATEQYLQMYEKLLGPYPYRKFALVENFWETGYGMPSFTLLGSRVIRLPFIIHSSYPHEILHNWWGNGVYVDFDQGNWSEGLTAYLADHLLKEQQGQAAAYRQQSLQKYADYAAQNRDFPLRQFRGRHSSASQAVGYGKTLMLFHMLRQQLGEDDFIAALRLFYKTYQFQNASFEDIQKSFELASRKSLAAIFDQWVERTGAPALALVTSDSKPCGDEYCLSFTLEQTQAEAPYQLYIPVAISFAGEAQAWQDSVYMTKKHQRFTLKLPEKPTRMDIDPEFDIFRKLAVTETPPAFSQLLGSQQILVILPSKADQKMQAAWRTFADHLSAMGPGEVRVRWDVELDELPVNETVVILGWENLHAQSIMTNLADYDAAFQNDGFYIAGQVVPLTNHSFALAVRPNEQGNSTHAFIVSDQALALPGLSRKLPHYHKYSYLAFSGVEPQNQIKGRWPVVRSPLSVVFSAQATKGKLRARNALASRSAVTDTIQASTGD